jgi:hypothetical protein
MPRHRVAAFATSKLSLPATNWFDQFYCEQPFAHMRAGFMSFSSVKRASHLNSSRVTIIESGGAAAAYQLLQE